MTAILILGEAWGEHEERTRTPFTGYAGSMLTSMLEDAGIKRYECFLTNVFNLHPAGNKITALCGGKSNALAGYPVLTKSQYVRREFAGELDRLGNEINSHNPNVIIALGNTPMWAMLGKTAITKYRGTTEISTHTIAGYKVLPTYHPSYIIRGQWAQRPTVVMDLTKAKRESEFPELRRPKREIWINPGVEDLYEFERRYIHDFLSVDIETLGDQITCVGFAPSDKCALVIPFYDGRRISRCYWNNADDERRAWEFVRRILGDKAIRKAFQNGLYDIAFLWRSMGLRTLGAEHDTMLLHHALQPESLKGLGYLGSLYTDESSWKHMRKRVTTIKGDA